MAGRRIARRGFGNIRQLPSGRWQARYTDPGGVMRKAPVTFDARIDAEAWLARQRAGIIQGTWLPEAPISSKTKLGSEVTFGAYAESWLATRKLAATTRDHYRQLLRDHLEYFTTSSINQITPPEVRKWHAQLTIGLTAKAH